MSRTSPRAVPSALGRAEWTQRPLSSSWQRQNGGARASKVSNNVVVGARAAKVVNSVAVADHHEIGLHKVRDLIKVSADTGSPRAQTGSSPRVESYSNRALRLTIRSTISKFAEKLDNWADNDEESLQVLVAESKNAALLLARAAELDTVRDLGSPTRGGHAVDGWEEWCHPAVDGIGNGETVRGLWTCCKRLDPDAPGCTVADHSNDEIRCEYCGGWVPAGKFDNESCVYHWGKPEPLGLRGAVWSCCGRQGWASSKYCDQKPEVWESRRRAGLSTHAWEALGGGRCESQGCLVGFHHAPALPHCSQCGTRQRRDQLQCSGCGLLQTVCTQCCQVVDSYERQSESKCRFHPGLFSKERAIHMQLDGTDGTPGMGYVGIRREPYRTPPPSASMPKSASPRSRVAMGGDKRLA